MNIRLKKSILFAPATLLIAFSLLTSLPAEAQKRKSRERGDHISWSQLTRQLENNNYMIREIEIKRNGWEAEVTRNGRHYELRLDRQGNIVRKSVMTKEQVR